MPGFHHVEVWVVELDGVDVGWNWLLDRLGFSLFRSWQGGQSWSAGGAYLTLTTSPRLSTQVHDRRRPGVNHLAFQGGPAEDVDVIMSDARAHGWRELYGDRYPHAGGEAHYAGWLENADGFKVEIVANAALED